MPAISCWSPMAAPGRCTPSRSRARSACATSSSRARPACSPPSACCSPTCATISCAPGSRRSTTRRSPRSSASIGELEEQGRAAIAALRSRRSEVAVKRAADMRYVGQEHAVTVDLPMQRVQARRPRRHQAPFRRRCMRCATAPRRPPSAPRSSACARPSPASCASRRCERSRAAARRRRQRRSRGKRPVYFQGARLRPDADFCARRASRRQPHQGPGADRGACLDHGADARRRARGRRLRQSRSAWRLMRTSEKDDL